MQRLDYPGMPSDPKFSGLMDKPKTRAAVDWFLDQMLTASVELIRMREHYENELKELRQQVRDFEAQFIRDSHNSSQPPSRDGLKKPARAPFSEPEVFA